MTADSSTSLEPRQPAGNPESGYWLSFNPHASEVAHQFCGDNEIPGTDCPNCMKPLLRILSLDARDVRVNLDPARIPFVHLFYCWTCSIPFGEFSYKIEKDGSIKTVKSLSEYEDAFGSDGPYDGYMGVFPLCHVALEPISDEDQQKLCQWAESNEGDTEDDVEALDRLATPRHQVGGYPFIANPERTSCPECGQDMPLLATICDDSTGNDPWGREEKVSFAGNGGVQMIFHLCRECSIVTAYHCCD